MTSLTKLHGWRIDEAGDMFECDVWAAPGGEAFLDYVNYNVEDAEQFANVQEYHTVRRGANFFTEKNDAAIAAMKQLKKRMADLADQAELINHKAEQLVLEFPEDEGLIDA